MDKATRNTRVVYFVALWLTVVLVFGGAGMGLFEEPDLHEPNDNLEDGVTVCVWISGVVSALAAIASLFDLCLDDTRTTIYLVAASFETGAMIALLLTIIFGAILRADDHYTLEPGFYLVCIAFLFSTIATGVAWTLYKKS